MLVPKSLCRFCRMKCKTSYFCFGCKKLQSQFQLQFFPHSRFSLLSEESEYLSNSKFLDGMAYASNHGRPSVNTWWCFMNSNSRVCQILNSIVWSSNTSASIAHSQSCVDVNFVHTLLNAEGEGWAVTAGTNHQSFHRLWQPEKGVSRKGWKCRKIGSERIISCYTSRGVLRHAWSKWCRENLFH